MEYFFVLCAFLLAVGLLKLKGSARLILFLIGLIFFQDRIILFNVITFHQFLIYILILTELFEPKPFGELRNFPLIKPLAIVFVGLFCIGMFDGRHGVISNLKRVADTFSSSFFAIYLFYSNFKKEKNWKQFYDFLVITSIILCLYGFYNFFTRSNPYDRLITNTYHSISPFDIYLNSDDRFRINSFIAHPVYYGYLTGIILLLIFYHLIYRKEQKKVYLFVFVILFLNLIMTNSRTPIIATFLGLLTYVIFALNNNAKITIIFYSLFISLVIYNVPFIQTKINDSLDIFVSGGEKTNGSTIKMRESQLDACYTVFKKSPILGNGLYYIVEDLGFSSKEETYDSDFKGFESYVYQLLIEQGLTGIITNLIFMIWLGAFFLRKRSESKQLSGLGFSILIMFLVFIIGTGPLGSWEVTMGFLGIIVAGLE